MTTASRTPTPPPPRPSEGEPAWDVAKLFPNQGTWSVEEYLELNGNRLVEFSNGYVEVLTMPTMRHQLIVMFLCDVLRAFLKDRIAARVLVAPFRIRLWPEKYREPDVMLMMAEHADRMGNEYWDGADLVMEVVSDDDRRRDLETKRFEYARAGIPEYWIVDPQRDTITVLKLDGTSYTVHGEFAAGARAASALLSGFSVAVDEVFAAR